MVPSSFLRLLCRCFLCLFCSTFPRLQLFQSAFVILWICHHSSLNYLVAHPLSSSDWNFCATSGSQLVHQKTWSSLNSVICLACSESIRHHLGLSISSYYSSDTFAQTTVQWCTRGGELLSVQVKASWKERRNFPDIHSASNRSPDNVTVLLLDTLIP